MKGIPEPQEVRRVEIQTLTLFFLYNLTPTRRVPRHINLVMNIPLHLKHKPIIGVYYENIDRQAGFGDAKFLSIGKSQWDNSKFSIKSFRESDNGWSPQSEELQFWRILDMTNLLLSVLSKTESRYLNEEIIDEKETSKSFRLS